jgi:hypothetical protein
VLNSFSPLQSGNTLLIFSRQKLILTIKIYMQNMINKPACQGSDLPTSSCFLYWKISLYFRCGMNHAGPGCSRGCKGARVAQGKLHDRVHQTMSVMLDALSVFKDGRQAGLNLVTSYETSVWFVHSTRENMVYM